MDFDADAIRFARRSRNAPNVTYELLKRDGEIMTIHNPQDVPAIEAILAARGID